MNKKYKITKIHDDRSSSVIVHEGLLTGETTTFIRLTNPKELLDEWFPLKSRRLIIEPS